MKDSLPLLSITMAADQAHGEPQMLPITNRPL